MSRFDDHADDVVELAEEPQRDAGEHAVATAVRRALTDDTTWTPERLRLLADAADHRATRRRRQRLLRTPAVLVAGVAAVTALVLTVPSLLPAPSDGGGLASQDPADQWRDATLAHLTPADVTAVLPDVVPLGPGRDPAEPPTAPQDACGTAPLTGVTAPLRTESGQWGTSTTRQVDDGERSGTETTTHITLYATVDTYADPAQAETFARALNLSSRSCTPPSGEAAPVYPYTFEVFVAPALFVSGYHDGLLEVTAVWTTDRYAATVHAWIPVAPAAPHTLAPNQVPAPVAGVDQQSLDSAVRDVVDLAATAAQRAAGS